MRKKRAARRDRAPQARVGSRTIQANGPAPDLLRKIDAYWRAANYLSVGQIYLFDNPLLKKPLKRDHVKPRLLGHWGTTPGPNFVYAHLNRVIKERDLSVIFLAGPGHGGPGIVANTWLEGTYSEVYPNISADEEGMQKLSSNSRSRAAFQVTSHLKLLVRFTRAVSSAMCSHTPSAPLSTTPISRSLATAKPRPARWPPDGTETNF